MKDWKQKREKMLKGGVNNGKCDLEKEVCAQM